MFAGTRNKYSNPQKWDLWRVTADDDWLLHSTHKFKWLAKREYRKYLFATWRRGEVWEIKLSIHRESIWATNSFNRRIRRMIEKGYY